MSITYHINCHDCKKFLWVGQRDRIYTTGPHLILLNTFLFEHENHKLSFNSDNNFEDYQDSEQEEEEHESEP